MDLCFDDLTNYVSQTKCVFQTEYASPMNSLKKTNVNQPKINQSVDKMYILHVPIRIPSLPRSFLTATR